VSRGKKSLSTWPARVSSRFLPFADAASPELPLGRLLRLGLFQASVGMALALLAGTLNRVMIVELGVGAAVVAIMLSVPLLLAPLRPFIGFRSDVHISALGWRRVPFIWIGTMLQFGGLALMPFALLLLTRDGAHGLVGTVGAALAFLMVGVGAHTVQTTGLALATDLAREEQRPRVVALLYLFLLLGMAGGALAFSTLLWDYSHTRLVQVVQGAGLATLVLNAVAIWKQEARDRERAAREPPEISFREAWRRLVSGDRATRLLVAVGLGSAGFAMQDVLLEPYGGEVMSLGVGQTSLLTALTAAGAIAAFATSARRLSRGGDPARLAGAGALLGIFAFAAVILSAPLDSPLILRIGTACIGFGGGWFTVATLTAAMELDGDGGERAGLAMGAWGGVQATCAGTAIALGGVLRDALTGLEAVGGGVEGGYFAVYTLEIVLLFLALAAVGPLAAPRSRPAKPREFGLAELPG